MTFDGLPTGDMYSTDEQAEVLFETDPSEALASYVFDAYTDTDDVVSHVRELAPLKLVSYRRMALPSGHPERFADWFLETLQEDLADDGYIGEGGEGFEPAAKQRPQLVALLGSMLSSIKVYGCEPIGHVELDADALERWVRHDHPEWVERKDTWQEGERDEAVPRHDR